MGQCNSSFLYRLQNKRLERSAVERDLGALMEGKLNSEPWQPGGPSVCWDALSTALTTGQKGDCPALLHTDAASVEDCVHVWAPQYEKDNKLLENIQRWAMRMVKGLEGKLYRKKLRSSGFAQLKVEETSLWFSYSHKKWNSSVL